ncbi:MAG: LuxR C-terminal-related transcriptional regulator [Tepidimonas sp.]
MTPREVEVLQLEAKGLSFDEVGEVLGLSPHTVVAHVKNLYRKLAVHSRGEAVFEARQLGLIRRGTSGHGCWSWGWYGHGPLGRRSSSLRWAGLRVVWLERLIGGVWVLATGLAALADGAWQRWLAQALGVVSIVGIGGVALLVAAAHDYLMFWHADRMYRWWPGWTEQGHLLLRHAVGVLLLTFGVLLLQRFVQTLDRLEELNRTLERRVAERERALRDSLARMTELERQRAVHEERERIVRELHDGLGSQLFVALSRSQRALLAPAEMTQRLRDCVAELRLALDVWGAPDGDLAAAWGDLRFRWVQQLTDAGLSVQWHTEGLDRPPPLSASATLQVLRITQEALTNVLRHARARRVEVRLRVRGAELEVTVEDDGIGFAVVEGPDHRGLRNMRARAHQLGARLEISARPGGGTVVRLAWTLPQAG